MQNLPVININHLQLGYKPDIRVFKPFSIEGNEGELIALVGRNGTGKSTLLRTLAGLQSPLSGRIHFSGKSLQDLTRIQRATMLSFVPAEPVKIPNLEVRNFVGISRFPYTGWNGGLSDADWKIVDESLQHVDMMNLAGKDITQISDGERQRAMIAFALAQDTKIILLDEPTAFLDLPNKFEMVRLLSKLAFSQGKTIVYSTHDLQGAIHEADTIWMMLPLGLLAGTPEELALSRSFDQLLENSNVLFDIQTGTFRNRKTAGIEINIDGEGATLHWTKKMLQRIGYKVVDNESAELKIFCITENLKTQWILKKSGETIFQTESLKTLAQQMKSYKGFA